VACKSKNEKERGRAAYPLASRAPTLRHAARPLLTICDSQTSQRGIREPRTRVSHPSLGRSPRRQAPCRSLLRFASPLQVTARRARSAHYEALDPWWHASRSTRVPVGWSGDNPAAAWRRSVASSSPPYGRQLRDHSAPGLSPLHPPASTTTSHPRTEGESSIGCYSDARETPTGVSHSLAVFDIDPLEDITRPTGRIARAQARAPRTRRTPTRPKRLAKRRALDQPSSRLRTTGSCTPRTPHARPDQAEQ
jgi:hypothetical protein